MGPKSNKKIKLPHPFILIIGIGFLLYARSFSFDYTNFDDNSLIQENQSYLSNISNLADAFRKTVFITGSDVFYRPVETVWFILNAQLAGSDWKELPVVFYLSSLLLHCVAVYLIFLLLLRFNNSKETSLFLSLIFLVHPVLVQSVAWVPGVVDILVTVFAISSFLFFSDFIKSQKRKHYVLHILFFALALYTKEIAIGLFVLCTVYYLFIYLKSPSIREGWDGLRVFFTGWLVVSAVWFLMRDSVLQNQQQKTIGEMISSMASSLPAFIPYIGKILFPFNLSVMPVLKDTAFIYGIAAMIIFSVVIFMSKGKRKNWIWFAVIWFAVFLLPTFIKTSEFRVQQFYEHRMYLPMVGFLLFIAELKPLSYLPKGEKIARSISLPLGGLGWAAIAILLFFFVISFRHEKTFSGTKIFLDNAVATSPSSSLAHRNLGIYFQDMDEKTGHKDKTFLEKAADEYKKSLELNPHEKDLHNNLGVIYDRWGKKDLAEKEYLAETKLNPGNSQAWHNLGVICSERNENEKAETYFKKAIEIHPAESTYQELALLYKKTGRQNDFEKIAMMQRQRAGKTSSAAIPATREKQMSAEEAEAAFLKTLASDSLNKDALFNLGLLYYRTNRKSEAEKMWRKSVQADSTYTDAYNNLAICLAQQGKNMEAEAVMKKLISSNPDYADGYFNIANFYARNGRDKDALKYVTELKKRGITKEQFQQRGIKLSEELEKVFDK